MFPAAVIDAGLGIIVRLSYYLGSTPVWRHGLRDLSTTAGDFGVDIPAGLTVTGEIRGFRGRRPRRWPQRAREMSSTASQRVDPVVQAACGPGQDAGVAHGVGEQRAAFVGSEQVQGKVVRVAAAQ